MSELTINTVGLDSNGHQTSSDNTESLHHAPRASVFQSFSTTCKCIVGSGILSLPYAFARSGWLVGMCFLFIVALLSYSTMSLIIEAVHLTRARLRRRKQAAAAHAAALAGATFAEGDAASGYGSLNGSPMAAHGSPRPFPSTPNTPRAVDPLDLTVIEQDPDLDTIGYQQVAYVAFGEWGRITADTILIFTQVGSCAAFLVLILTNIQACLSSYGIEWPLQLIAIPIAPIVLGLSLPRSTTYLAPAAHFGNLTLLVGIATIVYYGLTSPSSMLVDLHKKAPSESVAHVWHVISSLPMYSGHPFGILVFFGISAFAFAAHCEIVAVEAEAKSRRVYQLVLPTSLIFIAFLYVSVAVFAYACFGAHTESNIMLNMGSSLFVNLVRIALSCTLLVNFALALFPASQTLDLLIAGPAPVSCDLPHQHENTPRQRRRRSQLLQQQQQQQVTEQTALLGSSGQSQSQQPQHEQWPAPVAPVPVRPINLQPPAAGSSTLPTVASTESLTSNSPDSPPDLNASEHAQALARYHQKGNWIRICVVLSTFAIGLLIQDLGVLFSLVGSVAGGILCFTMPPLFWYKVSRLEQRRIALWLQISLLAQTIFGLVLVFMGIFVVGAAA